MKTIKTTTNYDMAEFTAAYLMSDEEIIILLDDLLSIELQGKEVKKFSLIIKDKNEQK